LFDFLNAISLSIDVVTGHGVGRLMSGYHFALETPGEAVSTDPGIDSESQPGSDAHQPSVGEGGVSEVTGTAGSFGAISLTKILLSKASHRFFNVTKHVATSLTVILNDIDETVKIMDKDIVLAAVNAWRAVYSPQRY